MTTRLETAERRRATTQAKLDTAVNELRIKQVQTVLNRYDAVDPNNGKKRRAARVERTGEDKHISPHQRLKATSIGRDIERNFTNGKSIGHQFKINVVGTLAKAQFNSDDIDFNKAAGFYFNSLWSKDCDSRDDLHFSEQAQLAVASALREGSALVAFDDFDRDDGKLVWWESDQLVSVSESSWKIQTDWTEDVTVEDAAGKPSIATIPLQQDGGIVRDRRGRVVAYVVTGQHGLTTAEYKDVTVLPRSVAKLLKRPWRFNQGKGVGDMLAASADLEDIYEMRAKELQTAKVACGQGGFLKRRDGITDYDDPSAVGTTSALPEEIGKTADEVAAQQDGERYDYDRLEALTGGFVEYLDDDDEFVPYDPKRPNVHVKEFFEFVQSSAGASFGLAKAYTTLSADKSYTAFRGDMILTWRTFEDWQKWIERHLCDWAAAKAVAWAISKGKITAAKDENWAVKISWVFPVMPQVDEQKEENAIRMRLKNGTTDYAKLLGPDWQDKLEALAKQLETIRELGLPLAIFETVSGSVIENDDEKENEESEDEQD